MKIKNRIAELEFQIAGLQNENPNLTIGQFLSDRYIRLNELKSLDIEEPVIVRKTESRFEKKDDLTNSIFQRLIFTGKRRTKNYERNKTISARFLNGEKVSDLAMEYGMSTPSIYENMRKFGVHPRQIVK